MIASPFSKHIAFSIKFGDEKNYQLHPEEAKLLSPRAVEKRRKQFFLGRAAAHSSLRVLLGVSPPPVLKGTRGEPIWPDGTVGAITHTDTIALAAVGRREQTNGIGIDLEQVDRKLSFEIADKICTPTELRWVKQGARKSDKRAMMVFSAKESIYKALYPIEKVFLDFMDAELSWDPAENLFHGILLKKAGAGYPVGYELTVGCKIVGGYVFTFLALPPDK